MENLMKFIILLSGVYLISSFELGLSQLKILKFDEEERGSSIYTPDTSERIIGGKKTPEKKYPFMISLLEDAGSGFEHICGGAILNENWIVTAAHCIDFVTQPQKYRILAGLNKLSRMRASSVQKMEVSKIYQHKDFDSDTYENDIALMKTTKPMDFIASKGYINAISLPTTDKDPSGFAKVIGWGHTYSDGENSDALKEVDVPIIERDLCNESYDDYPDDDKDDITEKMICAGMTKRDSCQNDSGGPLFQTSPSGVRTLLGVVSHGAGCGQRYYPGVYTKVSSYKEWIEMTIAK